MSEKKVEVKLTADTQALIKALNDILTKMTTAQELANAIILQTTSPDV